MKADAKPPQNLLSANLITAVGVFLSFAVAAIAGNILIQNKYVCVALGLGTGIIIGWKIPKWYVLGGFVGLFLTIFSGTFLFTAKESANGLIIILFEIYASAIFFFWKLLLLIQSFIKYIENQKPPQK